MLTDPHDVKSASPLDGIFSFLLLISAFRFYFCWTVFFFVRFLSVSRKKKHIPLNKIMFFYIRDRDEHEPLNGDCDLMKKPLSAEYDGRTVHSRSGDFLGKNSAV